jgi:hypothetical protein
MNAHVTVNGNALTVTPGSDDAAKLADTPIAPTAIETPSPTGSTLASALISPMATGNGVNTNHNEWIFFNRINTAKSYDYIIGKITPNTWYVSGNSNKYYSPQERELYLGPNRQDAIEVVVNYDHYTHFPNSYISLFPAIYDNHAANPSPPSQYESWDGIIQLVPSTFPHAYGYHVQISNGKYYISFQDMNNGQWIAQYVYNDQDNPSTSFTEESGSAEFWEGSYPITDTFYAYTTPIIDMWDREAGQSTFVKPYTVWKFNTQTQDEHFVYITWSWGGQGNQELITNSYAYSGWA